MSAEPATNLRHLPDRPPTPEPASIPAPNGTAWPEHPAPLSTVRALSRFPVGALPDWLADYTEAVAETLQTPLDLPGALALATLSTAAGGRVMVQVRPGWGEQTTLYTVVILEPSARKSPAFTLMTEPIRTLERALREEAKHSIETARMQQQMALSARDKAQKDAATLAGQEVTDQAKQEDAIAAAVDAALEAESIGIPHPPQLIADDVTVQKVATILAQQGGRLAVLSDEGTIFENVAGRYSGNVNAEVFLKGYSGTELRVDRGDRSEYVERPALTLGLTIQPTVIDDLPDKLRGNGFLARILFARPAPLSGHRKIRPAPIPQEVADTYHGKMLTIARELHGFDEPVTLTFSKAADDFMADIEAEIEPKLDPHGGEWADIADWAGKLAGQTARIAALLHLAKHPIDAWNHPEISDTTVADAWTIARHYATHAQVTLEGIGESTTVGLAKRILGRITQPSWEPSPSFTIREAFRKLNKKGDTAEDFKRAFELLEDLGHVAAEPQPERSSKGGRTPSPRYWLHPAYRPDLT